MASQGRNKLLYWLLLLMVCWQFCPASSEGMVLTLGDVFPFGTGEGDEELPTGNDESVSVPLGAPIPYFGEPRSYITVRLVCVPYSGRVIFKGIIFANCCYQRNLLVKVSWIRAM